MPYNGLDCSLLKMGCEGGPGWGVLAAPPSVLVGMGACLTRAAPGLCVCGPRGPSITPVLCLTERSLPTPGSSGPQVQPRTSCLAADGGRTEDAKTRG